MKRSTKASFLLVLICAQAAFANPLSSWFLGKPDCSGFCKQGSKSVAGASVSCPDGYTLEKDKLNLPRCVKRTLQPCPTGFDLRDGKCYPADSLCFPTVAGLCPAGTVPKANCSSGLLDLGPMGVVTKVGQVDTTAIANLIRSKNVTKVPVRNISLTLPSLVEKNFSYLAVPRNISLPIPENLSGPAKPSTYKVFQGLGRRLQSLGEAAAALFTPAVEVNAERVTPLVVLPKPIVSFTVPDINAKLDAPTPLRHPNQPIVILPQPALSFIEPTIDLSVPPVPIHRPDRVIPVLPTPKLTFLEPVLNTQIGGLNINKKLAIIDATRLGPKKVFEVTPPPINPNVVLPTKVDYIQPPRTIVDLSKFGPTDATVVQLPKINIPISSPIEIKRDPATVNLVNLGGIQKGPVYEVQLPPLPQRNKVTVNLPKVNFDTVVLPGHREKEVVQVNVQNPDMPPTHQIHVTVDASKAALINLPHPLQFNMTKGPTDTKVHLVTLPPVKIPPIPPVVTIDLRRNKTGPTQFPQNVTMPDLEVVHVDLPGLPKFGRDVTVNMPTVNLNRYLPQRNPEDDGALNFTVTLVNATMPSLNRIEALNKPLIQPADVSISTKGPGFGKGATGGWGVSVHVEDTMTGKPGKAVPIEIGAPFEKDSVVSIVRDALGSVIDSKSGQFCKTSCCPAPKPQPEKIEYAEPVVSAAASAAACPPGKKLVEFAPGVSTGLCADEKVHFKLTAVTAKACLAQASIAACPAT